MMVLRNPLTAEGTVWPYDLIISLGSLFPGDIPHRLCGEPFQEARAVGNLSFPFGEWLSILSSQDLSQIFSIRTHSS